MMKHTLFLLGVSLILLSACDNQIQKDRNRGTSNNPEQNLSLEELLINAEQNSNIGNYEKAIELREQIAQMDSLNPMRLHELADAQMDYYQSQKALKTLEKAARDFPDHLPSLLKLGETYFILKQHKESIQSASQILQIQPSYADAHFLIGMNYYELGQSNAAFTNFQKTTDLDPDHKDGWLMLGTLYTDREDDLALACFDNVLLLDSNAIEALHNKAFHYQNTGRLEIAKAIYRDINEKNPQYADAFFNTGLVYMEQDSLQEALDHFYIVTKVQPDYAMAYYYQGQTLEKMKRPGEAIKKYEEAVRLVPNFVRAQESLKYLKALHPE